MASPKFFQSTMKLLIIIVIMIFINEITCDKVTKKIGAEGKVLELLEKQKLFELMQERELDLCIINGNSTVPTASCRDKVPLTSPISGLFHSLFSNAAKIDYPEWFITFSGLIFDGFVITFILLPIFCIHLCLLVLSINPPIYQQHGYDAKDNIPIVPLIYLQQTKLEQILQRPKRNTLEWFANKFIVKVSDNLLYLSDLSVPIVKPEPLKNPWKNLRILNKFRVLYERSKFNLGKSRAFTHELDKARKNALFDKQKREADLMELKRKGSFSKFFALQHENSKTTEDYTDDSQQETNIKELVNKAKNDWQDKLTPKGEKGHHHHHHKHHHHHGKKKGRKSHHHHHKHDTILTESVKMKVAEEEEKDIEREEAAIKERLGYDKNIYNELVEVEEQQQEQKSSVKKKKKVRHRKSKPDEILTYEDQDRNVHHMTAPQPPSASTVDESVGTQLQTPSQIELLKNALDRPKTV